MSTSWYMKKKYDFGDIMIVSAIALNIGLYLNRDRAPTIPQNEPAELSDVEKSQSFPLTIRTIPKKMSLEILSADAWTREPNVAEAASRSNYTRVTGLAITNGRPCTIQIPEGWEISIVPRDNVAWFQDTRNARTIAHEIAHCMVGDWHQKYDEAMKKIEEKK